MFRRQTKQNLAVRQNALPKTGRLKSSFIRSVLLVLIVAVVGFSVNKVYQSLELFPVKQVKIEGKFKYLVKAEIEERLSSFSLGGFFDVDIVSIRSELITMPWVARAFVRREWPDTVVVNVVEKQAVAKWRESSVLTMNGDLFYPADIDAVQPLPKLSGPENRHSFVMAEFLRIQKLLSQADVTISSLTQNDRRSWKINVQGMVINLGRKNIHKKLESFVGVYASLIKPQLKKIKQIDFRYTNGFSMVWKTKVAKNMQSEYTNKTFMNQKKADLTLMMGTFRNV